MYKPLTELKKEFKDFAIFPGFYYDDIDSKKRNVEQHNLNMSAVTNLNDDVIKDELFIKLYNFVDVKNKGSRKRKSKSSNNRTKSKQKK